MQRIHFYEFSPDDLKAMISASIRDAVKHVGSSSNDKQHSATKFYSVKEAASYLGIAVPTLYTKISRREIGHSKTGKLIRFSQSDLDQFLSSCKRKTREEIIGRK